MSMFNFDPAIFLVSHGAGDEVTKCLRRMLAPLRQAWAARKTVPQQRMAVKPGARAHGTVTPRRGEVVAK